MFEGSSFVYYKDVEGSSVRCFITEYRGKRCWVCGKVVKERGQLDENKGTQHHLLPKALNPLNNVIAPLCLKCHRAVHSFINYREEKNGTKRTDD